MLRLAWHLSSSVREQRPSWTQLRKKSIKSALRSGFGSLLSKFLMRRTSLLWPTVGEEEGRLDVLVNNAGASPPLAPIAEGDAMTYIQSVNVNLSGTYLMVKSFLHLLVGTAKKENTVVDVVNMSSIRANMVFPTASAHQISKAAVSRLTEFVDLEYGEQGVNCVAIHPGGVLTELSKGYPAIRDFKFDAFTGKCERF